MFTIGSKYFTCNYNPYSHPMEKDTIIFIFIFQMKKLMPREVKIVCPKVTHLSSSSSRIWTQAFWLLLFTSIWQITDIFLRTCIEVQKAAEIEESGIFPKVM